MKSLSILAIISLLSSNAFALTTDTLLLQATVAKKVSLSITAESVASNLDLETSQSGLKIATLNLKSNSNNGYSVTISSANLGNLKRVSGTEVFNYSLAFDSNSVDLSSSAGQTFNAASATVVDTSKDLTISYTGKANEEMVEGSYVDTVTVSIASI